jgi:alkanesulfonate monooxygenase SsuD/methylene tetrahydromethanopterin reductase-like flavin-dependent oxidoreductase (luciferase family)
VDIGIGIPNTVLDVPGTIFPEWARRAEERGFSSLSTIGRVVWPGYDEFVALAACAAVTEHIRLITNIALMPTWDAARFAKVTASLDQISNGRLALGVAVGARPEDFEATGRDMSSRGRTFDEALEVLDATWQGKPADGYAEPFGPPAVRGRIPLLFGGDARRSARRAAQWGGGFTIGGAPFEMAGEAVSEARSAFEEAGGTGDLRIVALNYFSLGDEHTEESIHDLRSYYEWLGDFAEMIAQGAARDGDEIRRRIDGFAALGIDELIWTPSVGDVDQVDRLADVALAGATRS